MKRKHSKKPEQIRRIAKERIGGLFAMAEEIFKKDSKLSDRYVEIARKISTKYKMRIPRELKRRFCKKCGSYLVPGANCRVRLTGKKVVTSCFRCKNYSRIPYN